MASIIAISNIKGGVGKSTIAINLAAYLSTPAEVLLVDADPQGSVCDWFRIRKQGHLRNARLAVSEQPYSAALLQNNIQEDSQGFDFVVIDCPPEDDVILRTAMSVADFCIIPVTPSPFDLRSANKTVKTIKNGLASGAIDINPRIAISKKITGTVLAREARAALEVFNIPIFSTEISQRIAFAEAGVSGKSIFEYEPASQAAAEFNQFGKEALAWLKHSAK